MYSIIVPTYNPAERIGSIHAYLRPCLESLYRTCSENLVEIIVVSNGCSKSVIEYLKNFSIKYQNFKFIHNPLPLGYAKATNLGIKIASNDYIVLLNDDTVLLEQPKDFWLQTLKNPLLDTKTCISGVLDDIFLGERFLIGFCLMIKKEFLSKYGLLDEEFSPGWGEDIDICLRAKKYGFDFQRVGKIDLTKTDNSFISGDFPIYHKGEATFSDFPNLIPQCLKLHEKMKGRILSNYYKSHEK